jgi:uncharacterized protein (DUF1501 family)
MINRRHFLGTSAAALLGGSLSWQAALARPAAGSNTKFIFVFNNGGWDVLNALVPPVTGSAIQWKDGSAARTEGGITFNDHDDHPKVAEFFQAAGSECLLIHGVQVPSIAHESCYKLIFTGSTSQTASDWGAILASGRTDKLLPHTIVDGFGNQGKLTGISTRIGTNGRLEPLLDGTFSEGTDVPMPSFGTNVEAILDAHLAERGAAAVAEAIQPMGQNLSGAWLDALGNSSELKGHLNTLAWAVGPTLNEQWTFAVDALEAGLSRCVTIKFGGVRTWDTHDDNDSLQSQNFNQLFSELALLRAGLQSRAGEGGGSLADETVVVVLSEMARTPTYNGDFGRDHWSYTSMLLFGPGLDSGRVVGAYDDSFYGKKIDPGSGEVDDTGGVDMHAATVGATLMEMVDIDYAEFVPGYQSIPGFLNT